MLQHEHQQQHEKSFLLPPGSPSPPPVVPKQSLSFFSLLVLVSFSFANGNILSTYFLITLPIESMRIAEHDEALKAIYLGILIALAGVSQLICPFVGLVSDSSTLSLGKRRPFMIVGGLGCVLGVALQAHASSRELWGLYFCAFVFSMFSLNVVFSTMIALVPDRVPEWQMGFANGLQSVMCVSGGLSGFAFWYFWADGYLPLMYYQYVVLASATILVTVLFANEDEPVLSHRYPRRAMLNFPDYQTFTRSYYLSPSSHGDFFYVTLSRTLYYMGISSQAFFMYYLKDIVKSPDPSGDAALLSAVAQFTAALTALPVGFASDSLETPPRQYIYLSCFLLAGGNAVLVLCRTTFDLVLLSALLGAANGSYLTMDTHLAINTLPDKAGAAKYLGIWGVASFIGTALGPMVGGPLLYFVGKTDVAGTYDIKGYGVLMTASVVYFALAAFVLRGVGGNGKGGTAKPRVVGMEMERDDAGGSREPPIRRRDR